MAESEPRLTGPGNEGPAALDEHVSQNIETIIDLQKRELEALRPAQRRLEHISRFVARPLYLVGLVFFTVLWIAFNVLAPSAGLTAFDPPPFSWLEGLFTFIALMTTTVVLIAQNRQTHLEQQRAHLDLQVNLLTEQKVTKLIHLLEELRSDLPIRDRHDAQADTLKQSVDATRMASALKEGGLTLPAGGESSSSGESHKRNRAKST